MFSSICFFFFGLYAGVSAGAPNWGALTFASAFFFFFCFSEFCKFWFLVFYPALLNFLVFGFPFLEIFHFFFSRIKFFRHASVSTHLPLFAA